MVSGAPNESTERPQSGSEAGPAAAATLIQRIESDTQAA